MIKRLLVGRALATHEEAEQRLPKRLGLAVFASDAISSTAYATEEILFILVPVAGLTALHYLVPLSIVVMVVLAIVVTSLPADHPRLPRRRRGVRGRTRQPRRQLGAAGRRQPAGRLLPDRGRVGVGRRRRRRVGLPGPARPRVEIAVGVVVFMTLANLRGAKESGTAVRDPDLPVHPRAGPAGRASDCSGPTRATSARIPLDQAHLDELTGGQAVPGLVGIAGAFILARAFSSGAVALTGTEAITNGVPAFRPPESRNAARTLVAMGVILGGFFLGISLLADRLGPRRPPTPRRCSVRWDAPSSAHGTPLYYFVQFTTMAHPVPGGEHGVRRLPAAVVHHGRRRLPAPPADPPRGPTGLLQRDPGAGGVRGHPARRLRRGDHRADPAVRGRGVHRVHHLAGRDGPSPPPPPGARLAAGPGHQRRRARSPPGSCS